MTGELSEKEQRIAEIRAILEEVAGNPDDYNLDATAEEIYRKVRRVK